MIILAVMLILAGIYIYLLYIGMVGLENESKRQMINNGKAQVFFNVVLPRNVFHFWIIYPD